MLKNSDIPGSNYRLANARTPACLTSCDAPETDGLKNIDIDIDINNGSIAAVHTAGQSPEPPGPVVDLDDGQVWPGFVDLHTHLDKGHIWPRQDNPDGSFAAALEATERDRAAHWSAADVAARMEFSLRCAYAHGTVAIRTHIDTFDPQHRISWPVFSELRERWAGRITLQAAALVTPEDMMSGYGEEVADLLAEHGGILGGVPYTNPDLEQQIQRLFALAAERGLDLDLHIDENGDPRSRVLDLVAETALDTHFPGRIVCGHCCSLAVQTPEAIAETLAKVHDAGITVASLPMCNLYLQDREARRTPRWRGVTLLHELAAAGVPVALASDNTRDPFYAYGDLDMIEVFTQAARIGQLDRPIGDWPAAVTTTPAHVMGLAAGRIDAGAGGDLVLCEGRGYSELLSRGQHRRIVLRAGRPIDTTPPDYRELDPLLN